MTFIITTVRNNHDEGKLEDISPKLYRPKNCTVIFKILRKLIHDSESRLQAQFYIKSINGSEVRFSTVAKNS